ncbi:MAG: hypothetical protein JWP08_1672, partial [Bryobacterales bacterium]|nr:hypothetical protein [Bryobacterales bacterium]
MKTRPIWLITSLAIFLIVLGGAGSIQAQFRASLQGTVADPSGAVVPGATVTLTNLETNFSQ